MKMPSADTRRGGGGSHARWRRWRRGGVVTEKNGEKEAAVNNAVRRWFDEMCTHPA